MNATPPPELRKALELRDQGRREDALEQLRRLQDREPANIGVLYYLGALEVESGNPSAALPHLEAVVRAQPSQGSAVALLSDAYQSLDKNVQAVGLWRAYLEGSPQDIRARLKLMDALLHAGAIDEADKETEKVLPALSNDADALLVIGMAYHAAGQLTQAIRHYRSSLEISPGLKDARRNLAAALQSLGDTEAAEQMLRDLLREMGDDPEVLRDLGTVLKDGDDLEQALGCYEKAMRIQRRRLSATEVADVGRNPAARRTTLHSLRLEMEQLEYLHAIDARINGLDPLIDAYREVIEELQIAGNEGRKFTLSTKQFDRIGSVMQRLVHVEPADAVAGGALNPHLDVEAIAEQFAEGGSRIGVGDDFLTPAALQALRDYCHRSTVWFGFGRVRGYCGAYMQDGFGCGLLRQIAGEIREQWPDIVGPHVLNQMWGYIYDQQMSGITAHADPAVINLNFWITPDDANLDKAHGGLVVGKRKALKEWDFDQYNNRPDVLENFMTEGDTLRVPYRCNRMVMFDSELVHKTDDLRFQPGFLNRRINITMLFGHRQN
ncbi:MAG: tetratricopeptide repeat protein [Gammaproteobacteria bacterium]